MNDPTQFPVFNKMPKEKQAKINKAVKRTTDREKHFKTLGRKKWWADKWVDIVALFVSVLSLIVSLIAIIVAI